MILSNYKTLMYSTLKKIFIFIIIVFIQLWLSDIFLPIISTLNTYLLNYFKPLSRNVYFNIVNILSFDFPLYQIIIYLILEKVVYNLGRLMGMRRRHLSIILAKYGRGNTYCDITDKLNELIINNKLDIQLNNSISGGDPVPGSIKIAIIKYKLGNQVYENKYKENDFIKLPI